ncbi:MAG: methyltransferase domain-containing protein [Phycisphaerales bacterium]|nr:methyltransferase domain-containing protein [Planctomycetota bacterium]
MSSTQRGGEYVHGTHRSEQERLSLMNTILNERTLRELAVREGDHVLDVGSGLGQMSIAIAKQAGTGGRVIGVERSAEQIEKALAALRISGLGHRQVDFRQGEAADPPLLPGEAGSFNLCFTRFLLEHVPDPLAVVRRMVQACVPGGRIVLADDDHELLKLYPEPAGFTEIWGAYMELYRRNRNDPVIGRRLVQLLHQAGATPTRNTWVWFGACSGNDMFEPVVDNLAGILRGAAPTLEAQGLVDGDAMQYLCGVTLPEFAQRPDAAVWFAMSLAEGTRPAQ